MSPQAEVKRFPGYGIIYPNGHSGIKVIRSYTEGPQKKFNPDGTSYRTTSPPVIFELYGGGFCYASGQVVNRRSDLEAIGDVAMRERALKWFDGGSPVDPKAAAPARDPEKKLEPGETVFVTSMDMPREPDASTQQLTRIQQEENQIYGMLQSVQEQNASILTILQNQEDRIGTLEGKKILHTAARKKSAEGMKRKWRDPEFRKAQEERFRKRREEKEAANGTSETSEEV